MDTNEPRISIQPYWSSQRRNLRIFYDPHSGRPLIATYEVHSPQVVDVYHTIPGTLLTGFSVPLDREDVPPFMAGTITRATTIPMYGIRSWFGCHLYPGMFTQIFGIPNSELPPEGIFMNELIPIGSLAEKLRAAKSQQEREQIAFCFVMDQLTQHRKLDFYSLPFYLADRVLGSNGTLMVKELAEDTAYSARYLQRQMKENLGISPKLAIDNVRLQRALHLLLTTDFDLTRIAQECGFYDQAHFVHGFRHAMGCTPRQFCRNYLQKR